MCILADSSVRETDCLQIPRYLPLRNYRMESSKHVISLGAGPSFYRISLGEREFQVFIHFLLPRTVRDAAAELDLSVEEVLSICQQLFMGRILIRCEPTPAEFKRYDRHLLYYSFHSLDPLRTQERLSKCKIGLIGMGGIGNWVSLNLIGLGVKCLKLIDPDVIEQSNLCRQILFSETDLGKKKVFVARDALRARNSDTVIEAIDSKATESTILEFVEGLDFVVLSADSPVHWIQKWTNSACIAKRVPFFNVGYSDGTGIVGPMVIPERTACLACDGFFDSAHFLLQDEITGPLDALRKHYQAPSFGCLNSLISSIAAYELVKYVTQMGECSSLGHRLYLDPLTFSLKRKLYAANNHCKICNLKAHDEQSFAHSL